MLAVCAKYSIVRCSLHLLIRIFVGLVDIFLQIIPEAVAMLSLSLSDAVAN